ncbi:hypothetical protein [Levilactobacillus brevis]|uniref:hypothetical protein n=1 Tax=Levilactobacillus brevis TaxID=1580 RepID=UPI00117A4B9A|nr:hypothetical protein [Levilactobacillus brevis]
MSMELVIVAAKTGTDGAYITPIRDTEQTSDIAFFPENDPKVVKITGYAPGDTVPSGKYFAAFYNPDTKKFLGQFVPVSGFTVAGESTPSDLKVTPTDTGAEVASGN